MKDSLKSRLNKAVRECDIPDEVEDLFRGVLERLDELDEESIARAVKGAIIEEIKRAVLEEAREEVKRLFNRELKPGILDDAATKAEETSARVVRESKAAIVEEAKRAAMESNGGLRGAVDFPALVEVVRGVVKEDERVRQAALDVSIKRMGG